jgi:thiamine biosynthesis protein ThiS
MITVKFNGKPTQIPKSTPITTFLTTHNYNLIHVVVELNEVIIPKDSHPTQHPLLINES